MKPIYYLAFLSFLLLFAPSSGNAGGSMLRIACEGDDIGAEVMINGQFKGECPIDLQVPAGMSRLQVQKKIKKSDYIFEQDILMGDGSIKKIEVRLVQKDFLSSLKAAEAGDTSAMTFVATYYSLGKGGVPQNSELSFKWALKAAKAGISSAMFDVGYDYRLGRGVKENEEKSNQWFLRAIDMSRKEAEGGNSASMLLLGVAYAMGYGVPIDKEKAAMWFHQAKEKGNIMANRYLEGFNLQ